MFSIFIAFYLHNVSVVRDERNTSVADNTARTPRNSNTMAEFVSGITCREARHEAFKSAFSCGDAIWIRPSLLILNQVGLDGNSASQ